MTQEVPKRRLGRGLAALIGEMDKPPEGDSTPPIAAPDARTPIEFIVANPRNPRREFADEDLSDLAQSIATHGIVQPIVVRSSPIENERYEIIAGERRWRAAQRAGLTEVPILIRECDDRVALEIAIVENVQRADLNAVEEALGYQQLLDEHSYTQSDLALVIGKSRSHVANTLRLLKLPDSVRTMLVDGALSAGHARTLITADNPEGLAKRIVDGNLSVRQAESLQQEIARKREEGDAPNGKPKAEKDANTLALEKAISDALGLNVTIRHGAKGGDVKISYRSLEQLDELCRILQKA